MKIHEAINKAIKEYGKNIILESNFINILNDFRAFEEDPAQRAVMKSFVDYKILEEIYNTYQSSTKSYIDRNIEKIRSKVSNQIAKNNHERYVCSYILNSLASSLSSSKCKDIFTQSSNTSNYGQPKLIDDENTQYLIIKIEPKDSMLEVDGNKCILKNGYWADELKIGKHHILVKPSSDKYLPYDANVMISLDDKSVIDVLLEETNPLIPVTITTNDSKTDIYIDNVFVCKQLWTGSLTTGEHRIKLHKEGFRDIIYDLIIKKEDVDRKIFYNPPSVMLFGTIKVATSEIGHRVFIDGKEVGTTPIIIRKVLVGKHSIKILTANNNTYYTDVEVEEKYISLIDDEIFVQNTNSKSKKSVHVSIEALNKETLIYIDGVYEGKHKWEGELTVDHHVIEQQIKKEHLVRIDDYFVSQSTPYIMLKQLRKK